MHHPSVEISPNMLSSLRWLSQGQPPPNPTTPPKFDQSVLAVVRKTRPVRKRSLEDPWKVCLVCLEDPPNPTLMCVHNSFTCFVGLSYKTTDELCWWFKLQKNAVITVKDACMNMFFSLFFLFFLKCSSPYIFLNFIDMC